MFHKLKLFFRGQDLQQRYLCEKLERSQSYLTSRLNGGYAFTLKEVYILCETAGIPLEKIPEYFPKDEVMSCKW